MVFKSSKGLTLLVIHTTCILSILSLYKLLGFLGIIVVLFFYLVGVFFDVRGVYPVRRMFLNLLAVGLSLYIISGISFENFVEPISQLVLLLLVIKSWEDKKPRDMYQMLTLSLLALSISSLYNISLSFLVFFLTVISMAVLGVFFINLYKNLGDTRLEYRFLKVYTLASGLFIAGVFVLSLVFFYTLPRSQTPLFNIAVGGKKNLVSGLARQVELGKVGQIQQDNTVAFRVFGLKVKNPSDLYWRVFVFDHYQGNAWINSYSRMFPQKPHTGIEYTIVLEPTFDNYLPALDTPYYVKKLEGIKTQVWAYTGSVLRTQDLINRPIKYVVVSGEEKLYEDNPPENYLDLPPNIPKSIRSLAQLLEKDTSSDEEKVRRVIEYFKRDYSYTQNLEGTSGDPLEYFLFVKKKGNCEYFASATAVLLRLMGVPARVVGGFKGGVYNPNGNYIIVTNSMAHVWVEAYVKGKGWMRIDTTPPYTSVEEISRFSLLLDAVVTYWQNNVVGFSAQKQIELFKSIRLNLSLSSEKFRKNLLKVLVALGSLYGVYSLLVLYLKKRKTPENLYRELLKTLGLKEALPVELLRSIQKESFYKEAQYIVELYLRKKYSPYRVYPDEVREGYRLLKVIRDKLRK
ncbi:transglutaminaseTgpA domain-containing protein [Thermocrinis minervae]|uniref:Transglutaminase-like enzyme, putative cysteine protease n=1 Tax=Thermocrinis minervae TaxID=381751 RepID=A0A1M6QBX7_9AQUI|nr:DUF3488 and transglutaminase-like domain-containing protein [Thermocrinis minervae]SHK17681.1 Transglutaminase-like enzyme, putative cysteine protease [Thermocrinis minervae]